MAIPPTAVVWSETMDPADILDFAVDCSTILEGSETITSFTIANGPESTLLGLTIATPTRIGDRLYMWLSLTNPSDIAFTGTGVTLPIEVTVTTSLNRKWQRTVVIRVAQK